MVSASPFFLAFSAFIHYGAPLQAWNWLLYTSWASPRRPLPQDGGAAKLADDVELGLDRIASNDPTAGPGARGASRRPQDGLGSPVPPDATPRAPGGAGREPPPVRGLLKGQKGAPLNLGRAANLIERWQRFLTAEQVEEISNHLEGH